MASAIERRFDLARAALSAQASEASKAQEEAQRIKAASQRSLQSGAAIKEAQAGERALSRKELAGQSDISRAQAGAEQAISGADFTRQIAQEEARRAREFAASEAQKGREFAAGEAQKGREFTAGEAKISREMTLSQAQLNDALAQRGIAISEKEYVLNEKISLDNLARLNETDNKYNIFNELKQYVPRGPDSPELGKFFGSLGRHGVTISSKTIKNPLSGMFGG